MARTTGGGPVRDRFLSGGVDAATADADAADAADADAADAADADADDADAAADDDDDDLLVVALERPINKYYNINYLSIICISY
jgi:hypothetical protein